MKTVVILLLILMGTTAYAQYTGGPADGADAIGTNGAVGLNGPISLAFFSGGNGDGHSHIATDNAVGLNGPISLAFFSGGTGDGHAAAETSEAYSLDGPISSAFFAGGNGDGFSSTVTEAYYGLNGPIGTTLFTGGNGDGFSSAITEQYYGLDGPIGTSLFTGGNGDGHADAQTSDYYALNGPITSVLFKGGNGDGFAYAGTGGDVSLPVMFSSMEAIARDGEVELVWITEAEINNAGFILLRRDDLDTTYREIASYQNHPGLKGAGNSNERRIYRFKDWQVVNGITYSYLIVEVDWNGNQIAHGPIRATPMPDGLVISRTRGNIPRQPTLLPNYPNPFNPETWVTFGIPATRNNETRVSIVIYDMLGRPVRQLINNSLAPGFYKVLWDGRNEEGSMVPSGIYILRLSWNGNILSQKLTLSK